MAFLRLGLTSFGGPVAHLGFFRDEFVVRRRWLSEGDFADTVALCQFLPGPASSQVGMSIGLGRAGLKGAVAAWCGFTLPSALLLIAFALGLAAIGDTVARGALHGLKIAAVAVVAQAVWGMSRTLTPDLPRRLMAVAAIIAALLVQGPLGQVGIILAAAVIGVLWLRPSGVVVEAPRTAELPTKAAWGYLGLFAILLLGLPILARVTPAHWLQMISSFYRAGALVFGGGHVVLPLLEAEVVSQGWVTSDAFLAGYGAAQAIPGPLFAFSAFLGASMQRPPAGWVGGFIALISIFLPSLLLIVGVTPFWERLRYHATSRAGLSGVNASVVGLLGAALYDPVWTSAINGGTDFGLALVALFALTTGRVPPWAVVAGCAAIGWLIL